MSMPHEQVFAQRSAWDFFAGKKIDRKHIARHLMGPVELESLIERERRYREALEAIAIPKRPDGTYNRCREACEKMAKEALR